MSFVTFQKLDPNEIIASAELISGVPGGISPELRARVSVWVEELNASGQLSPHQAFRARQQIVRLLAQRLRIAADRIRLPDIAKEEIKRPIFVVGFARTGTTLLHSLLNEDVESQSPKWWQTHLPSPPPGEMPVTGFRLRQAELELERMVHEVSGVLELHPYWDQGAEALIEDEQIFTLDFCNSYPTLVYRVPVRSSSVLDRKTAGQAYRFHREFLQHMQWNRPSRHWVLKGVRHQVNLDSLFDVYPDAICVWPHRETSQVMSSFLAISALWSDSITGGKMDWKCFGSGFVKAMRENIDKVLSDPLLDDPRIMHVRFNDLVHAPVEVIEKIYTRFDLTFTATFKEKMQQWLLNNPSNRYGQPRVGYEAFGLDKSSIKEQFADYASRFGLT